MNYEKKYKEVLEEAKKLLRTSATFDRFTIARIFPELERSEDERIKKTLIENFKFFAGDHLETSKWGKDDGLLVTDILAWLEKQGGESNLIKEIKRKKELLLNEKGKAVSSKENLSLGGRIAMLEELLAFTKAKQGEQNDSDVKNYNTIGPHFFKTVEKVEPKFKIGDWIACKGLNTALIVNIDDDKYEVEFIDGNKGFPHINYIDRNFHRWTIQDAKDGDVLFYKGNIKNSNGIKYERICLFNNLDNAFFILTKTSNYVEECDIDVNIDYPYNTTPATKEQRDLLFSKMKEAGYEWDAENKKLNKKK